MNMTNTNIQLFDYFVLGLLYTYFIDFADVCQGYEECIKEGHHGMCDISKDGEPICQCKPGWTGEFCDEEIIDTTPKPNS